MLIQFVKFGNVVICFFVILVQELQLSVIKLQYNILQ